MSELRIYDSNGQPVYPDEGKRSETIDALALDAVELYVNPQAPRIVGYVKGLIKQANDNKRFEFYHAEYLPENTDELFEGFGTALNSFSIDTQETLPVPKDDSLLDFSRSLLSSFGDDETQSGDAKRSHSWKFDRSTPEWNTPWLAGEVDATADVLPAGGERAVRSLLGDGERLEFGTETLESAIVIAKHFSDLGCTIAINSQGRTRRLSNVGLVLQPGEFDEFTPLTQRTRKALERRRATLSARQCDSSITDIEATVRGIASDESDLSTRRTRLQSARKLLSGDHSSSIEITDESLRQIQDTITDLENDPYISDEQLRSVRGETTETVRTLIEQIDDQMLDQAAQRVESAVADETAALTASTGFDKQTTRQEIFSRIDVSDTVLRGTATDDEGIVDTLRSLSTAVPMTVGLIIFGLGLVAVLSGAGPSMVGLAGEPPDLIPPSSSGGMSTGGSTSVFATAQGDRVVVNGTTNGTWTTLVLLATDDGQPVRNATVATRNDTYNHVFWDLSDDRYSLVAIGDGSHQATVVRVRSDDPIQPATVVKNSSRPHKTVDSRGQTSSTTTSPPPLVTSTQPTVTSTGSPSSSINSTVTTGP